MIKWRLWGGIPAQVSNWTLHLTIGQPVGTFRSCRITKGKMTDTFDYRGFKIPTRLALRTGSGGETFEKVSNQHFESLQLYFHVVPSTSILDVGCGVGRSAIRFIEMLGREGTYLGTEIDRESVEWCREHITTRHPNFRFEFFDINNESYNPSGRLKTDDYPIPLENCSVDLVILQSVFTHISEEEIAFYMGEFSRVLRPGGIVYSTFFLIDDETLDRIKNSTFLTFRHQVTEGAWVHDANLPSAARGYSVTKIQRLVNPTQLVIHQGPFFGTWSGRPPSAKVDTGQDLIIFKKNP